MRRLETLKFLEDILSACRMLEEFTSGRSYADYCGDALLRSGVERQFEIIGEALNRAVRLEPDLAERIEQSARIVAFRNRLIHAYGEISNELVWSILETRLGPLQRQVAEAMEDEIKGR